MCFVLYAGTSKPMPRKEWSNDAPDLSVQVLTERESPIAAHFSKPTVHRLDIGLRVRFPIRHVPERRLAVV